MHLKYRDSQVTYTIYLKAMDEPGTHQQRICRLQPVAFSKCCSSLDLRTYHVVVSRMSTRSLFVYAFISPCQYFLLLEDYQF